MSDLESIAASLPSIDGASDQPLEGKIDPQNHGFSMPSAGPLWPSDPVWHFDDIYSVIVDYVTDADAAAAALPADAKTVPVPGMPGYSLAKVMWNNMRDSSMADYFEHIVCIPCTIGDIQTLYVPFIYVTNDRAVAAGREGAGFPKKLADIDMPRFGNRIDCVTTRGLNEIGRMRFSATGTITEKLFSTPMQVGESVDLPFPQNITLPLPSTEKEPLEYIPFPTLTWRFFRGVGSDKPEPAVSQLVNSIWRLDGTAYNMENVSLYARGVENDPVDMLPIRKVLGGTYIESNTTLPLRDMTIVKDHLP